VAESRWTSSTPDVLLPVLDTPLDALKKAKVQKASTKERITTMNEKVYTNGVMKREAS
jgi:hypothetical protein